jgi:periplasmic protein TonB
MLESFTEKRPGRGRRLLKVLFASLLFHGVLVCVLLFVDFMRVDAMAQPPVLVTFVDYASLPPPPPPPPPPKKKSSAPKPETKPEEVKPLPKISEFMAPKEIPQEKPSEPDQAQDDGVEGGVEGGVVGGVVGGIIGGIVGDAPPPAPPPPPPAYQPPEVAKKRRTSGREPEYPRIARAAGLEATILVKIFITPEGDVGEVQFLKSDPHFEEAIREALRTWKFSPHMINGRAVGTYTVYKFVFKLE